MKLSDCKVGNTLWCYTSRRVYARPIEVVAEGWVIREETPKGFWIVPDGFGNWYKPIWISRYRKYPKFCPTKKQALTNMLSRQTKRMRILQNQLQETREIVREGERMREELGN